MSIEKPNTLSIGEIVVERTGFKPGDRILEFVARCWVEPSFSGLRFAYGDDEQEAQLNLQGLLDNETASAKEACPICLDAGYVRYGHDREVECECVNVEDEGA